MDEDTDEDTNGSKSSKAATPKSPDKKSTPKSPAKPTSSPASKKPKGKSKK
jgi:hypothetical protein